MFSKVEGSNPSHSKNENQFKFYWPKWDNIWVYYGIEHSDQDQGESINQPKLNFNFIYTKSSN